MIEHFNIVNHISYILCYFFIITFLYLNMNHLMISLDVYLKLPKNFKEIEACGNLQYQRFLRYMITLSRQTLNFCWAYSLFLFVHLSFKNRLFYLVVEADDKRCSFNPTIHIASPYSVFLLNFGLILKSFKHVQF